MLLILSIALHAPPLIVLMACALRCRQVPTREELLHHMPTLAELEEETLIELKETARQVAELTGVITLGERNNDRKSQVPCGSGVAAAWQRHGSGMVAGHGSDMLLPPPSPLPR